MIDSLRLDIRVHPGEDTRLFYVEKGADTPSPQGTHLDTISEDYRWTGTSSTYARPPHKTSPAKSSPPSSSSTTRSRSRAGTPASNSAAAPASPSSAPTTASTPSSASTPNPAPSARASPPAAPSKHPPSSSAHSAAAPTAPPTNCVPGFAPFSAIPSPGSDPHYPYVVNNSWGSGMAVDEPLALRMISESKELGVEMFHIDAGWFRGVGDWYPDPKKFPHGLAPIADEAHKQGLRFGIWVDWTQAALTARTRRAQRPRSQSRQLDGQRPRAQIGSPKSSKARPSTSAFPPPTITSSKRSTASSTTTTSTCSSTTAISSPRAAPATTTPTPRPTAAP